MYENNFEQNQWTLFLLFLVYVRYYRQNNKLGIGAVYSVFQLVNISFQESLHNVRNVLKVQRFYELLNNRSNVNPTLTLEWMKNDSGSRLMMEKLTITQSRCVFPVLIEFSLKKKDIIARRKKVGIGCIECTK